MGNGLSNIHLDPGKVNKFLLSSPLKLVSGNLSEIKLSVEIGNKKLAVTVGTLNLVMYADTASQYEYFKQDRDTMQDADSMMDDPEDTGPIKDETPTLIDKIVSSFEVEVLWKGANIEIQLGREANENSRFFLSVGNITAKKLKKKSEMLIHELVASVGSLAVDFMRAGETHREKMLSLHVVQRQGKAVITQNAIEVTIDIMKEISSTSSSISSVSRFMVVRANAGALQGILTLQCVLELGRLFQKIGSYMKKNMLMQRELLKFVKSWNRDHNSKPGEELEFQEAEFTDEMFKSCVGNPLLASFAKAGGLQDGLMSSMRFQSGPGTLSSSDLPACLTESFISRKQQAAEVAKQALNKEFEDTITKGSFDIEVNIQGIYIAFLKIPTFETSEIFSWPTKLEQDQGYHLHGVLANHFLFYSELIQFQFQTKSKEGKRVLISSLGVKDFMKKQDPQAIGKSNQSFLNRVDIQGLDESRLTHGNSSLYSSNNEMSKSLTEEDGFEFKSAIDPSTFAQYKEVEILKFEKLVQIKNEDPSAVVWVTFNVDKEVPEVSVKINTVMLNIELDSFTLMSNRQEFANLLRKTTDIARNQTPPSMESYGDIQETDVLEILSDLKYLLSQVGEAFWRRELLKLFQIQDPNTITKQNSMKLSVDINKVVIRTGGVLDVLKNKSVWADLELGAISILIQKQIIVTWRHPINLFLQHTEKRAKVLSLTVCKEQRSENLVAIDEECLVTKLTGVDIFLSPEIFEGMLLLIDLSNHKLKKLDYSQEKFKLADAIAEVQKAQSQNEVKYQQELQINEVCDQVMLKLVEGPPLVSNCYVFVGCISLYLHDEDITQEILTSLRVNRGKKKAEVWETIEMDGTSTIIETDSMALSEDKTMARLKEMNVVIQLDIRPVMIKTNTKGEMAMMIHTILLRDGMTALSMQELKDNYKTHFCELYSINYKQARYDAKLANDKFVLVQALSNFKKVMNDYSGKGPFMMLNIQEDPHNGGRKEIDIKMSSLVFRLGLGTARETFLCLIKIVDKTISKLNSITEVLKTMQQTHETEDMRDFRKKKAESVLSLSSTNPKMPEPKKPPEHEDRIKIQLDTISVDLFNENYYRLILNVANTSIRMGSAALEFSKTFSGKRAAHDPLPELAVDIGNVKLLYRDEPEYTRSRSVDAGELANKYYPLLLLPQAQIILSAREEHGVPIKFTNIYINPNSTLKGPMLRLDTYSISVLLQIVENLDKLVSDAKMRTKHIFVERVEVFEKDAEMEPSMDEEDEFVTVGERCSENIQVDRLLTEIREEAARNKAMELVEFDEAKKEPSAAEMMAKVQMINQTFSDHRKVIEACHVDGFRRGRQISVTSINVDRFVVELIQKYEANLKSSLSLQLKKTVCVLQTESSFEDEKKKGLQRNRDTTSLVLSMQSLGIRDNTMGGMFKHLLKVQKHSISCFFRSRVTSDKMVKQRTDAAKMLEDLDLPTPGGEPMVYSATHTIESSLPHDPRIY